MCVRSREFGYTPDVIVSHIPIFKYQYGISDYIKSISNCSLVFLASISDQWICQFSWPVIFLSSSLCLHMKVAK